MLRPSKVIRLELFLVRPSHPFLVVSEAWPSCLITILSLRLPIAGAFFPAQWHRYFKLPTSNQELSPWLPPSAFKTTILGTPCIYVVTGKAPFVASILDGLGGAQSVIVGLERNFRQSDRMRRKEWVKGVELLAHKGLRGVGLRDHLCGGATDGRFQFGFGHGLGTATLPTHVPDVQRSLRHYLNGGVRGNLKRVKNEELLHLSSLCRLPV